MRTSLLLVVCVAGCTATVGDSDAGAAGIDANTFEVDAAPMPDAWTDDSGEGDLDAATGDAAIGDAATDDASAMLDAGGCTWEGALTGTVYGDDASALALRDVSPTTCVGTSIELRLTYRDVTGAAQPELTVSTTVPYDAAPGTTRYVHGTYLRWSGPSPVVTGRFVVERVAFAADWQHASLAGVLTIDDPATASAHVLMTDCLVIPCL